MEGQTLITCKDRSGSPFEIRRAGSGDLPSLLAMYEVFSPRPASQGLPPPDPETCAKWVKGVLEIAENLIVWRGDRVIGHAALIPDGKRPSGEFIIFVHQDYRSLGIGTELTRTTLQRAKDIGLGSVWLTVAVTNFIAVRLYRKLCFEYCDMDECERTMLIKIEGA